MAKVLELKITIHYDESTIYSSNEFEYCLEQSLDRAIGEGLLSPTGEEVIDEFDIDYEWLEM